MNEEERLQMGLPSALEVFTYLLPDIHNAIDRLRKALDELDFDNDTQYTRLSTAVGILVLASAYAEHIDNITIRPRFQSFDNVLAALTLASQL